MTVSILIGDVRGRRGGRMTRSVGSHHSASPGSTIWLTPPHIIDALGGPDSFDLDPCTIFRSPIRTARKTYSQVFHDGYVLPWLGRIWLNPPYTASEIGRWLRRLADHGRGTALIFARTETKAFFDQVWNRSSGLLFIAGRLHFHDAKGVRAEANGGAPSVLCAYGQDDLDRLAESGIDGHLVPLRFARFVLVGAMEQSWREAVLETVRATDGPVVVADLYKALQRHPKARRNANWRAKVRQTLQRGPFERVGPAAWQERAA